MSIESWNLFCSLSTIDRLLRLCNTLGCYAVKHRGIFEADEPSVYIYGGNRSRTGACAAIHHQFSLVGVCTDKVLKQGNRLLRGVDTVYNRRDKEHVAGVSAPVFGFCWGALMLAVYLGPSGQYLSVSHVCLHKIRIILAPVLGGLFIRKASPQTPFLRLPSKKPYSWGSLSSRIHWLMPVR